MSTARPLVARSGHAGVDGLMALVGRTPLLEMRYRYDGKPRRLFAKYEALNLTGSVKDRMAAWILGRAYQSGKLVPGAMIVEASSGNTGISFSAVGRALGHKVRIYMPDWMSQERSQLIRALGAEVVAVSREQGGFLGSIKLSEDFARETDNVFLPRQFESEGNVEAHEAMTGPEIERQLETLGLCPDAFVAGVGTGGTVMGVGRYLRRKRRALRVHPLEPANSPTLRTGHKVGKHRIQGISDEFIPPIVHLEELDRVLAVDDGDAILMAQRLAAQLGIGVGISSGANFLAAMEVQEALDPGAVVVTVFADSNKKYLSTDLMNDEPVKPAHRAPHVTLLGVRAYNRVCDSCVDPFDPASAPAGFHATMRRGAAT